MGKAIRRALDRVAEVDPALGEELRAAVRTGARCGYRPVEGREVVRRNVRMGE